MRSNLVSAPPASKLHCVWLRMGLFVLGLFNDVRPIWAIGPIRRSIRPKRVVWTGGMFRTDGLFRTDGMFRTDGTVWTDGTIRRGLAICPIWFVQALLTLDAIRSI